MKPPGTYRLLGGHRARQGSDVASLLGATMRTQRIVDSLRSEIENNDRVEGVRIRQIFKSPREIFRIELEVPEMSYQRITLLDREALEELLEADTIRELVRDPIT